jgi:hypothetical protein
MLFSEPSIAYMMPKFKKGVRMRTEIIPFYQQYEELVSQLDQVV